jgi:alpha-tubulin suppressor-like RCC1 family protein
MTTKIPAHIVKRPSSISAADEIESISDSINNKLSIVESDTYAKLSPAGLIKRENMPAGRDDITWLSTGGYGVLAMIRNGELWTVTTSGTGSNPPSGRGTGTTAFTSLAYPGRVIFPSNSKIKKVGGFTREFAFALMENGELYTWGNNTHGQCGLGHTLYVPYPVLSATDVVDVYYNNTSSVYAGIAGALFIKKTDGKVYATGYNGYGQLGVGDTTNRNTWTEIKKAGNIPFNPGEIISVYNIAAEYGSTFVVTEQSGLRKIWATGYNNHGQLGNGNTSNQLYFVDVTSQWTGMAEGPFIVKEITAGTHYYYVDNYGNIILYWLFGIFPVYGWGYIDTSYYSFTTVYMLIENNNKQYVLSCGNNNWGQIGNGTTTSISNPYTIQLPDGERVKLIRVPNGFPTLMILTESGTLYGCGANTNYNLGLGDTVDRSSLVVIDYYVDDILNNGDRSHMNSDRGATFIRKGKKIYSFGYNADGRAGVGTTSPVQKPTRVLIPDVPENLKFGSICATESEMVYVITFDSRLFIWGNTTRNILSSNENTLIPTELRISF